MRNLKLITGLIIVSVLTMVSCTRDESLIPETKGRLNVYLTDAPFPIGLINSAWVKIDRVEIRQKLNAVMDDEEGSFLVIADDEMEFNLLDLTNGVTALIATEDLDPGSYDMIRLRVVDSKVVMNDGMEYDMKVPSGSASGLKIKINPAIQLTEGQTSDVLLDFDVTKSFVAKGNVKAGNILGFIFKPVARGIYLGAAGRIEGNVVDSEGAPVENAWVKLLLPGGEVENEMLEESQILVSTYSDAAGKYKLIGLPSGTYSMVCELDGFASDTITGVEVSPGSSVSVDFTLNED